MLLEKMHESGELRGGGEQPERMGGVGESKGDSPNTIIGGEELGGERVVTWPFGEGCAGWSRRAPGHA